MINHTIGERIRVFRFDNVMTCEELAAAVGMKVNTLRGWETNRRIPTRKQLEALAEVLGVGVDELEDGK